MFTETTETDITTTEIIRRRDVGPYGIRSEYCIRKIICPLGIRDTPKGKILTATMMRMRRRAEFFWCFGYTSVICPGEVVLEF